MTSPLNRLLASSVVALLLVTGCAHRTNLGTEIGQLRFGVKAARMNLWREARFRFERSIQIDPNDAMARNNLAVAYEATGDFEKARAQYIEALRIAPADQHIQKNFSRFTEYYTKYRKTDESTQAKAAAPANPAATTNAAAPPPAPPAQNPPPPQAPVQNPPPPQTPSPSGGAQ